MAATDVDIEQEVRLPVDGVTLVGDLARPAAARGAVLFAHGSGSSRHSPRNRAVARVLRSSGLATLLIDLLTRNEEAEDAATGHLRFDIALLARRLVVVTDWLHQEPATGRLPVGYFGASTGGGSRRIFSKYSMPLGAEKGVTPASAWNSVAPSGLVRKSVRCTTPTVTASFGTSDSASFLAIAAGTASARRAAVRNSFFI